MRNNACINYPGVLSASLYSSLVACKIIIKGTAKYIHAFYQRNVRHFHGSSIHFLLYSLPSQISDTHSDNREFIILRLQQSL